MNISLSPFAIFLVGLVVGCERDRPDEERASVLGEQARTLAERGELGEAIQVAARGAAAAPHDAGAWLLLGDLQTMADRPGEATASYRACVDRGAGTALATCRDRAR